MNCSIISDTKSTFFWLAPWCQCSKLDSPKGNEKRGLTLSLYCHTGDSPHVSQIVKSLNSMSATHTCFTKERYPSERDNCLLFY
jgi:hypothetical protein